MYDEEQKLAGLGWVVNGDDTQVAVRSCQLALRKRCLESFARKLSALSLEAWEALSIKNLARSKCDLDIAVLKYHGPTA